MFTIRKSTKKKQFKLIKNVSPFNGIILLILALILFMDQAVFPAGNSEKKFQEIQGKLKSKLDALKETSKKEKSVTEKLDAINRNIDKKEKEFRQYSKQMSRTQSEIQSLTEQINVVSGKLEGNIQYLEEIILAFYKKQYDSNALILLSANDYQDLIKKMKYASLIAHYDGNVINQYGDELKRINDKKNKLEVLQKELDASKENARKRKSELHKESQKKDELLARLKMKRNEYEKNIKELEKSSQKVQSMLKGIKSKKLPKSITGKGFKALKGKLPWPVDGGVMIPYGRNMKLASNTSAFRSGIEIKAEQRNIAEAVAGGRVVYADVMKEYGKLVIIDHGGGYHSLYGNLSEISLERDNIVITGFEVGKMGTSKIQKAPTLFFEIRYNGKPVDPKNWLGRNIRK